jgi:hypothetical protein
MDISRFGQLYSIAAANMLTEMVLPNRRGVDTSTSCDRWSQPLTSRIRWWSLANTPCGSRFQKMRAHARMKLSWNMRWWNDRSHPRRSIASSACRHRSIRRNPLHSVFRATRR